MPQNNIKKYHSKQLVIDKENAGRRIDNFLIGYFGRMPKSRVYQMLRKGEVRVNKGRIKQTYRLQEGDSLRLPPIFETQSEKSKPGVKLVQLIKDSIIYEDEGLLLLNKPANLVVHGGTGQAFGIIEIIRSIKSDYEKLELVHRLDKDTSGCLLFAKNMAVLKAMHESIKKGNIKKMYLALLAGRISEKKWQIDKPLRKNALRSGERIVSVDQKGKNAVTYFFKEKSFANSTLCSIELITGRTHQIRVHSESFGHPILGDLKYGDRKLNNNFKKLGLKRMFLHASSLDFISPVTGKRQLLKAPLTPDLSNLLSNLSIKSK